jgi:GAF domain-containing protein
MDAMEDPVAAPPASSVQPAPSTPAAEQAPAASSVIELEAFFHLGQALVGARDREPVEAMWTHLQAHLPATTLVLYIYDSARDAIAASGEAGVIRSGLRAGTAIPLGERLSGWVAATGQSVMNSDARLDLDEAERERSPLRSALAVPMMSNGRVVGVLSAYASQPDAFGEPHRRLLQAAAAAAAGSLERRYLGPSLSQARRVS